MSVNAQVIDSDSEQVFLLRDYSSLCRYWKVRVRRGAVLDVQQSEKSPKDASRGILERWKLAGQLTTMAFLSVDRLESIPTAPDYSRSLLVIVNERILGDGLVTPQLKFRQGSFSRDISIWTDDGWRFRVRYSVPWLRETVRKFNLGGTLEYDPADFIERLVEIVGIHRRHWLVDFE